MRQATVVRIPTMPSINPTKRRLWEYIFPEGTEGHWSGLQGAMGQSRIFQDSAGTTPVTTFDQPVGKIVRGAGTVDLVQSVSASRLTMARWPKGGRRNLLVQTENYSDASWTKYNTVVDGSKVIANISNSSHEIQQLPPEGVKSGGLVALYVNVTPAEYHVVSINVGATRLWATFDLSMGVIVGQGNNAAEYVNPLHSITALQDGSYDLLLTGESVGGGQQYIRVSLSDGQPGAAPIFAGDEVSGILVNRVSYEYYSISPYQRVTTANDVTEEGVESLWHLYNDGGDSLQTDGPVPAGTYGYAYVDPYGEVTFDTRVSDGINPVTVADAPGRYLDLILRKGDFSTGEKENITSYWERRYK